MTPRRAGDALPPSRPGGAPGLATLAATKEVIVTAGAGGVGKTTAAAALAATAAVERAGRTLVLTVDPARRLATSLGLTGLGNEATQVPPEVFAAAGCQPRGELWAAMLDTKQSWDDLVRRHAPDTSTAERILGNRLYENITGRFVQSHEYIAVERLYELHLGGRYDLIVVDTPPSRNAIDFLEAPDRMAEFFSSRLLKLLTAPYRNRLVNVASRPFYAAADRILGSQLLQDIAEFFTLFQTMYPGFVERADAVGRLLRDRRTAFVVVTTLEPAPAREAAFFVRELGSRGFPLGAVVLNRVLPAGLLDEAAAGAALRLEPSAAAVAEQLAPALDAAGAGGVAVGQLERVLAEVAGGFLRMREVALREGELARELLGDGREAGASVPWFGEDVHDLAGLLRVGRVLWGQHDGGRGPG